MCHQQTSKNIIFIPVTDKKRTQKAGSIAMTNGNTNSLCKKHTKGFIRSLYKKTVHLILKLILSFSTKNCFRLKLYLHMGIREILLRFFFKSGHKWEPFVPFSSKQMNNTMYTRWRHKEQRGFFWWKVLYFGRCVDFRGKNINIFEE